MGVNLIFRIAAVGILVSVICQVLKHSGREEQAFLTSLQIAGWEFSDRRLGNGAGSADETAAGQSRVGVRRKCH